MAPKVVCWRRMYDPSEHDLLRDAGAEVLVVDTTDAQEVETALDPADEGLVRVFFHPISVTRRPDLSRQNP